MTILRATSGILLLLASCARDGTASQRDLLDSLSLDNGARWQADEHTRRSIAEMIESTRRVEAQRDPATTAVLGRELQEQLEGLIAGCTMEGPAHEALHVYLSVLIPRIGAMLDPDPQVAEQARADVTRLLERFADYFA